MKSLKLQTYHFIVISLVEFFSKNIRHFIYSVDLELSGKYMYHLF